METHTTSHKSRYFVPAPSAYPFLLTAGLVLIVIGVWGILEEKHIGLWPVLLGVAGAIFIIARWFNKVFRESEGGAYNAQVDRTFRLGMVWFIFSEKGDKMGRKAGRRRRHETR